MNDTKKLQELDSCLASLEKSAKELKACMNGNYTQEDMGSKMNSLADSLYASMSSLRNTMYNLHESHAGRLNEHLQNHVPALKTASHVENFLKAVGMDNDVEVVKPKIYASYASRISASPKGMTVELDFKKPKNS